MHPKSLRVPLFFLILFSSLFIADGIQAGNDIFWPVMTLLSIPLWEYGQQRLRHDTTEIVLWMLVLATLFASTVTSWAPGYSISALMRILVGLIWMKRFADLPDRERRYIPVWIILFTAGTIIASLLFYSIAGAHWIVQAFSLLWSPSGHIPFVYITLPFLPIMIVYMGHMTRGTTKHATILTIIVTITSIMTSFSRAAIALSAVYAFTLFAQQSRDRIHRRVAAALIIASVTVFSGMVWLSTRTASEIQILPIPRVISAFLVKGALTKDARFAYIQESIQGFRQSPLLGTGPGTFTLVSKELGKTLYDVSDYTHNIAFELLMETGTIGTLLALLLAGYYIFQFVRLLRSNKLNLNAIHTVSGYAWAIGLILALGLVESNLNHYPIWITLMMLVGLIHQRCEISADHRWSIKLLPIVCIVGIYALSWIASDIALFYRSPFSFKLAPYRLSLVITRIQSPARLTNQDLDLILLFHPWNEQIALSIARRARTEAIWQKWIQRAMREYPSDTSVPTAYLDILAAAAPAQDSCTAIRLLTKSTDLPCMDSAFLTLFKKREYRDIIPVLNSPFGQSKLLYEIGRLELGNYEMIPSIIALWTRARDLAPQWGYFHIELASLTAYYNNQNEAEAAPVLNACLSNKEARFLCQKYLSDLSHLTNPGFWHPEILEIPLNPNRP